MKDLNIISDYIDNNMSLQRIADKYNISRVKVTKFLREENVALRKKTPKFNTFNSAELLEEYKNNIGIRIDLLATKYGVSIATISSFLKKSNVKTRGLKLVNTNRFSELNPSTLYWIGMICSDGSIERASKKGNPRICLYSQDMEILEKFKTFLNAPVNIKTMVNKSYNSLLYFIRFSNLEMVETLKNYNINSNKSLDLRVDNTLFTWDFIRGIFDGDGCFYVKQHRFDITTGSEQFALQLQEFFSNYDIKSHIYRNSKDYTGCYRVCISKISDIKLIYNYLYSDADYYLQRKHDKFIEYFNQC